MLKQRYYRTTFRHERHPASSTIHKQPYQHTESKHTSETLQKYLELHTTTNKRFTITTLDEQSIIFLTTKYLTSPPPGRRTILGWKEYISHDLVLVITSHSTPINTTKTILPICHGLPKSGSPQTTI